MGLRLRLLNRWTPKFLISRELDRVRWRTTSALDDLLEEFCHLPKGELLPLRGPLEVKREAMAREHNRRVETLVECLGEEGMRRGRERMYQVGREMGREAGKRLKVRTCMGDLLMAARIMYRVLGIDFEFLGGKTMRVNRCSLSRWYTPTSCRVMSAADEGVVNGLCPPARMKFERRMTEGHSSCLASIDCGGIE